ncbi:uncharacterized protein CDAR_317361 [Caerostris darwini]|uniref:Uncharacterized protein n=1 Tax=Caerostris darwini TaxID=1538125 RepID=A0AAV4V883_9ARAC|nr:uncharacterized protein CDAR_317361 [Caerostris darwini]
MIEQNMKNEKNFRGVFTSDMLPKQVKKDENGIINLDISTGPGTHWVCYFNDSNNNFIEYFDPFGVEHSITIPNGNYMISELNEEIEDHFNGKSPIIFDVHQATSRFIIKLDKGFTIDFEGGNLHEILGFESKVYDQPKQRGKYIADISKGIDDIFIHCDLITSLYNEGTSDILYLFSPLNPPGSMIVINEINPLFEEVNRKDYIDSVRMYITDQNDNIIDLNHQRVIYKLILD